MLISGWRWLAVVVASGLARAGKTEGVPLKLKQGVVRFRRSAGVGEGQRVPVGGANVRGGAAGGHLDALMYAREHDCPWSEQNVLCVGRRAWAPCGVEVGAG